MTLSSAQYLARLSWDDLNGWAGASTVARGRRYGGHVSELGLTPEGFPLASVRGTRRYATLVRVDGGRLSSLCTCYLRTQCKHAIAVILKYLELAKAKTEIPTLAPDDLRLAQLERLRAEDEDDDEADHLDGEALDDETPATRRPKTDERASLREYLEEQPRARLVALLDEVAAAFPDARQLLEDRRRLESGDVDAVVSAIRTEIADLGEPEWGGRYGSRRTSADFGRLRMLFDALVSGGNVDRAMDVAEELLEAGVAAVESYDREGDVAYKVGHCLETVFAALPLSSLPPAKQLDWVVEIEARDGYDLCHDGDDAFWRAERPSQVWNELVTALERQLKKAGRPQPGNEGFTARRRRDRLTDRLVLALRGAGRDDEIAALCEREAGITGNYKRLVEVLRSDGQWAEVAEWCRRALEQDNRDHYGREAFFRETLTSAYEHLGDFARAAALLADEFFATPGARTFFRLVEAADRAKVKRPVEKAARKFLETGALPTPAQGALKRTSWPLPDSGVRPAARDRSAEAPLFSALVDVAIEEGKPSEVLKWYDLAPKRGRGGSSLPHAAVAAAVRSTHPDRAVEILKRIVDEHLEHAQARSYAEAAETMREIRDTLLEHGRRDEWERYLARVREENRRRPRCIEILKALESRPIIETL